MMAVALVPLSDLAVETGLALPVGATRIAPGIWMLIILCHALLSVLFALALRRTLPARFQQPRRAMTGFLFAMFLALPGVGPLILLLSGFYLRPVRPASSVNAIWRRSICRCSTPTSGKAAANGWSAWPRARCAPRCRPRRSFRH